MNKGDAQPGVHVQNTQITQKTAVHEQNADFAFRTAWGLPRLCADVIMGLLCSRWCWAQKNEKKAILCEKVYTPS